MICPPCGPFSWLQNLNYDKMEVSKAMAMLGDGLQHLEFSMKVYEWQVRRGRKAIFEHPARSKAWDEECVQRVLRLEGVQRVRGDQCAFGLQVSPHGELSNGSSTGSAVSRRTCTCSIDQWHGKESREVSSKVVRSHDQGLQRRCGGQRVVGTCV